MSTVLKLPHEVHEGTCYVNGLFDILTWKGARYDYFLLPVIGGMAGFAFLKFKTAKPPCMVYWGANSKYLIEELAEIIGFSEILSEGKAFRNEFPKMKAYLDEGQPLMVGAMDMFYLHYYPDLYHKQHVPIHYVLLVGYDDERRIVFVQDCSVPGVQEISYEEFEKALNVSVSGMSKKNTYRAFEMPSWFISELELAEKGLTHKAEQMLKPDVNMLGIPAMHKLAKDLRHWTDKACFRHMVAYAGLTPPLIDEDLSHNDGGRFELARVLKKMGQTYSRRIWEEASNLFAKSGESIIQLCNKALSYDGENCSKLLQEIAGIEEKAYKLLL